jgi:hypothetical protein
MKRLFDEPMSGAQRMQRHRDKKALQAHFERNLRRMAAFQARYGEGSIPDDEELERLEHLEAGGEPLTAEELVGMIWRPGED